MLEMEHNHKHGAVHTEQRRSVQSAGAVENLLRSAKLTGHPLERGCVSTGGLQLDFVTPQGEDRYRVTGRVAMLKACDERTTEYDMNPAAHAFFERNPDARYWYHNRNTRILNPKVWRDPNYHSDPWPDSFEQLVNTLSGTRGCDG
jgi:hypothetical protein